MKTLHSLSTIYQSYPLILYHQILNQIMEKQTAYGFVYEEQDLMEFQNLRNEKVFLSLYERLPNNFQSVVGKYRDLIKIIKNSKTNRKIKVIKRNLLK